jgi:hypothetical protein
VREGGSECEYEGGGMEGEREGAKKEGASKPER